MKVWRAGRPLRCTTSRSGVIRVASGRMSTAVMRRFAVYGTTGKSNGKAVLLYLSEVLAGERVGLTVCGDGIWEVRYRFHPPGRLDERRGKVLPLVLRHNTQHDQV